VNLWRFSPNGSTVTCVSTLDSSNNGHDDSVLSVAFHTTLPLLATCSEDNTAKLWRLVHTSDGSISAAICVATLDSSNDGHSDGVESVVFHPTLPLLATGSYDRTAKLWRFTPDGSAAICVATLEGHYASINSVAFHPTLPLLATGSFDYTTKLWRFTPDGSAATCVATLDSSNDEHSSVYSVAFHPTLPLLATGSSDYTAKLWRLVHTPDGSISAATCVATLDSSNDGHIGSVYSVAFHPTLPLLATGSEDNTIKLWKL
jgi:WD40 repeat protein